MLALKKKYASYRCHACPVSVVMSRGCDTTSCRQDVYIHLSTGEVLVTLIIASISLLAVRLTRSALCHRSPGRFDAYRSYRRRSLPDQCLRNVNT